jgi:hypothetical protein
VFNCNIFFFFKSHDAKEEKKMVLVSHRYKFIFLKSRKTAGTSVEAALQCLIVDSPGVTEEADEYASDKGIIGTRMQGKKLDHASRVKMIESLSKYGGGRGLNRVVWYHHKNAEEVKLHLGEKRFDCYLKFTIVRNPWDKIVSLWRWQTLNKVTTLNFRNFVLKQSASDDLYIYTINGQKVCKRHIRFENLRADLEMVLKEIGVEDDKIEEVLNRLPRFKDHGKVADSYRDYYKDSKGDLDQHLVDHVARIYAREIRWFGYKFM